MLNLEYSSQPTKMLLTSRMAFLGSMSLKDINLFYCNFRYLLCNLQIEWHGNGACLESAALRLRVGLVYKFQELF